MKTKPVTKLKIQKMFEAHKRKIGKKMQLILKDIKENGLTPTQALIKSINK